MPRINIKLKEEEEEIVNFHDDQWRKFQWKNNFSSVKK